MEREAEMFDVELARLSAHGNNIRRYRRLLETQLTDVERDFISRRLEQEERALQTLTESCKMEALPIGALGTREKSRPSLDEESGMTVECYVNGSQADAIDGLADQIS